MTKKLPLAWNGAEAPKKPSEGFATSIGMSITTSGGASPGPAPTSSAREQGETFFDGSGEAMNVDVRRMGETVGPEVVRPSGRIRVKLQ